VQGEVALRVMKRQSKVQDVSKAKTSPGQEGLPEEPVFYRSALFDEFSRTASVTTMEPKFYVSRNIAEFWCAITSPAYAAPCIFWTEEDLPWTFHLILFCCFSTAVISTAYHAILNKVVYSCSTQIADKFMLLLFQILSTLDVGQAVITFYLVALVLAGVIVSC
jgi:hypothetical protein